MSERSVESLCGSRIGLVLDTSSGYGRLVLKRPGRTSNKRGTLCSLVRELSDA